MQGYLAGRGTLALTLASSAVARPAEMSGTIGAGLTSGSTEAGGATIRGAIDAKEPRADGFYVYGSWFVTGETRPFKNGNFDRVRPLSPFSDKGGTGAFELLLRYDELDAGKTPIIARPGNDAHSFTFGANWYLTANFKLQFNYIRFAGTNTPLDPIGIRTRGDAIVTRLHIDW